MEDTMTVSKDNCSLEVFRDSDATNPREKDNLGKMICWHRKYQLGDRHDYSDMQAFLSSDEYKNAFAVLPLYGYDHSGLSVSNTPFNGQWDKGFLGYIVVTKEKAQERFGNEPSEAMKQQALELLESETKTYDNYLQGECYAFKITDKDGKELDADGGFFGDDLSEVLREMCDSCNDEYMGLFDKMSRHSSAYAAMM